MTDTLMSLAFDLPWPPSVNTYWRHIVLGGKFKKARAQVLISEQGREYRIAAIASIREQQVPREALHGRLGIRLTAHPPDNRRRDLDNTLKGLLDALGHAHVIEDDSAIDELLIVRGPVRPQGLMRVELRELGEFNEQRSFAMEQAPANGASPF